MQYPHIMLGLIGLCALVPALAAEEDAILMPPVSVICVRQHPALATTPLGAMMSGVPELSRQVDAAKTCLTKEAPLSAEFCTELLNRTWKSLAERPASFREIVDKHQELSRLNGVAKCL
ncbi:hypothetical protein NX784_05670 [Massilia pinisoli]|uniref:Secreted protein n=1 Tax=Massilia pinisoli TaxID=1772194 RepID=A0ABT1ZME7_9BURK|nr:hypothetical protein [Massilia pinisoli]MCS0581072.1 hypothetical protein [Massilia pinisoli]